MTFQNRCKTRSLFLLFALLTTAYAPVAVSAEPNPPILEGGGYVPPETGECGTSTSDTVVAIPFTFFATMNKGRWITLSATSANITFANLSGPNPAWGTHYKRLRFGGTAAILQWVIASVPQNGTLYEVDRQISAGDVVRDPDDLFFAPNTGFVGSDRFSYCAIDSSGKSVTAAVDLRVHHPASYPMPVGVENPGFGIDEEPPPDPSQWPDSESDGNFFIDSDAPNCTDSNTYGWPNSPRCTIPHDATVGAGMKMVLSASNSAYRLRNFAWHRINLNGAPGNEAWLIGDERAPIKPRITSASPGAIEEFRVDGQNYRIGGVSFDGPSLRQSGGSGDNAVFRYSEVMNYPSTNGGGTTIGLAAGGTNVLMFHVNAHDNGIVCDTLCDERDIHAFVGSAQDRFWMIDIMCAENAGDCVQLTNNNLTRDVWVGRATMHSMMENCIDYKDFNRFVVSESSCWDLRIVSYTSGSGGLAQNFYVNDEGNQQNYGYFLNNRSWDTNGQNFSSANIGGRVYFIGNRAFFSPSGVGLGSAGGGGERHYYFNTVSQMRDGINFFTAGDPFRFSAGNIISNVNRYGAYMSAAFSNHDGLDFNIYDGQFMFAWGSARTPTTGDFAAYKNATGFDSASVEAVDPRFRSEGTYDFALLPNSPAINWISSTSIDVWGPSLQDFSSDLGITLTDFQGDPRPEGGSFDAGADEYR